MGDKNHRILTYGGEQIRVELLPRAHPGTTLRIKVHPDLTVQAVIPDGTSDADLDKALRPKTRWIWQKLRDFRAVQEHATPRMYVSGESHFYLGRRHLLKVHHQPDAPETVRMLRGRLEVSVQERNTLRIQKLLELWYFARAQEVFRHRLSALLPTTLWVTTPPALKLQVMQTQWGNCSPGGTITLNPHLVKAPRDCIDYVILHELCHLKEHNHGPAFWSLLERVMPDWERHKTRLDGMAEMMLQK
ncbi:metal-dependent hydrolase [Acetobacter tropicalis NRIC 0312]|uniref:Metal-dependent hydrolase n=1 Tax=Acetobacter tropicalis TaxID=104102 RepID=A0A511FS91_9PROT|nr:SprT family zinc-dependent metalloprotease [Acetobacter tropicalis]KXV51203.1 metal-dependent hydrolase [Acetobacter tropicalis]GAL97016.1 metal-dependent hydrolase [Acetobacter tropicalis]GBR72172.1 metal-dependent hydrolase [Acetobacter tropicalis NRIC 0312]GEL51831.1 metal-dependent hydrolase [Acetobacter tropicalis]